jgi:hypothetical protein
LTKAAMNIASSFFSMIYSVVYTTILKGILLENWRCFFCLIWKIIENCVVTSLTCRFLFSCFVLKLFHFVWYAKDQLSTSHMHNDLILPLSNKFAQNEWWARDFVHNNTHVGFLLIVFSRIKDIQLLGVNHYAYVT